MKSFNRAQQWVYDLKDAKIKKIIVLCGNKCDLVYERQVSFEMASQFASE